VTPREAQRAMKSYRTRFISLRVRKRVFDFSTVSDWMPVRLTCPFSLERLETPVWDASVASAPDIIFATFPDFVVHMA
jgi:hypothetical protein